MKFAGYTTKDMASNAPVPEATYRLRLAKMEYYDPSDPVWKAAHPTSKAKAPGLNADFVIQDETVPNPEPGGEDVAVFGRHLFVTFSMGKGKDWALRGFIEAVGKDEDWELDTDELTDAEVMGVVTIQPGNAEYPEPKNNVKKFLPVV